MSSEKQSLLELALLELAEDEDVRLEVGYEMSDEEADYLFRKNQYARRTKEIVRKKQEVDLGGE